MTTYQLAAARITAYQRHTDRLEAEIRRYLSHARLALTISVVLNLTLLVALTATL